MKSIALALALMVGFVGAGGVAASNGPTVTWTVTAGYDLTAAGTQWPGSELVAFELSTSGWTNGLILRTDPNGAFKIGIKHYSCSQGGTAAAADLKGHQAMAPVMDPCGPHGVPQRPSFIVLVGRAVKQTTTSVVGLGNGKPVTIRQGSILGLWEKGKKTPNVVPSAPKKYFFLTGYRQAPSPACHKTTCPAGFMWDWAATAPGRTSIDLRPWCDGQICPQYWVAALRVHIIAGSR